jgi:4'-phosphopantetheinyl transferase
VEKRQYVSSVVIDIYRICLAEPATPGCADGALRELLTQRLGAAPELEVGPHGKPAVGGGGLEFNVTHSGMIALVAISDGGPIGVDVEEHRALADPAAFARRFFSPGEAEAVRADPVALFRWWCRKEAWLKAQGVGLRMPLGELDVREPPPGWLMVDLNVGAGYSAAVVREGGPAEIRLLDYSADSTRAGDSTIARKISR